MRRALGMSTVVLFLGLAPASAQKLLPGSAAGWANAGQPPVERAMAPQVVLNEYGLDSTESARFAQGHEFFDAYLYKLKDVSGAYGLYSYLRAPEMKRASFSEHSAISHDRALVLDGNLLLDVAASELPSLAPQIKALVAALAPHAEQGSLPSLPLYLPEDHRLDVSDRYILGPQTFDTLFPGGIGNSIGFDKSAEAELARYRVDGHDQTLVIVGLPTDQLAAVQLEQLENNFNVNRASSSSATPLYAKRTARLLGIVAGASSQAEADTLLDQIQLETERSWNEPVPKHEPPIELMIEGSIIGALTICLFALIAGFSFGGVRLIVKRLAPGKVFDRSRDLQVLQLGLGSKPINSDDFYAYSAPVGPVTEVDKNLPDRIALRIFR